VRCCRLGTGHHSTISALERQVRREIAPILLWVPWFLPVWSRQKAKYTSWSQI